MSAGSPSTRVKLYFKGRNLRDADVFSKSDPYCALFGVPLNLAAAGSAAFNINPAAITSGAPVPLPNQPMPPLAFTNAPGMTLIGRTETIINNLNPQWKTTMEVPFLFESKQVFRIRVLDDDGKGPMSDDKLGEAEFQLSHVMCALNQTLVVRLSVGMGEVIISAEEASANKDTVVVKFRGSRMKKMDTFSDSDCYFYLKRLLPGGQTRELYKSEVIDNSLQPIWREIPLNASDMFLNDPNEPTLEFHCWDEDMTSDDYMGKFRFSFSDLNRCFTTKTPFRLLGDNLAKEEFFGDIFVDQLVIHHRPTFVEFLKSGMEINLAISIDFTGSNGDPRTPGTLHFMDPARPNQYLSAIMGVGEILIEYDSDKQIPVFGFGAGFGGVPNHFFNVNQEASPYVNGVQGVINAYGKFLPTCTLWGPTNFAPTIQAISDGCNRHLQQSIAGGPFIYTVLLIITDGAITDVNETLSAIVNADGLPLSIVIVGVGNADFSAMDMLDADGGPLRCPRTGRFSRRDLVQFVPFRDFANMPREALAAAVLREVPQQVEQFAELHKIQPRPRVAPPQVGVAVAVTTGGPRGAPQMSAQQEMACPIAPPPQAAGREVQRPVDNCPIPPPPEKAAKNSA